MLLPCALRLFKLYKRPLSTSVLSTYMHQCPSAIPFSLLSHPNEMQLLGKLKIEIQRKYWKSNLLKVVKSNMPKTNTTKLITYQIVFYIQYKIDRYANRMHHLKILVEQIF